MLLDAGVPEVEISEAFACEESCGGGGFQDIYRLRPLWGVYMAATNLTNQPIRLDGMKKVPHDVKALLLTELESEITHVVEVRVNGVPVTRNHVLHQGETLRVSVAPGDWVWLKGYYLPCGSVRGREPDPWWKNEVVAAFMQGAT